MNDYIPSLTLTPDADDSVTEVAAAAEIQKETDQVAAAVQELKRLTPEEQKIVDDFARKIDITDTAMIMQYGAAPQKKLAGFSDSALEKVRTKDLGEIGGMMTTLVGQLRDFTTEEEKPKGLFGLFRRAGDRIAELKTKYDSCEANVDKIAGMLEDHQVTLIKDIAVLDKMYDLNLGYFKELTMYILAGKEKLEQTRTQELAQLQARAQASGLPEDAQAANDMANFCNRFEKKLYDLELTRNISIQMAPQIRLIQNNNSLMAEKIQSTIVNTIPLWKSQMLLALGMAHSRQAMEAQRAVTDMTNEMLRRNAETLKMNTIETAKEAERGIVDIETLRQTNQSLISTLDEVMRIQEDGRTKRAAAEDELLKIEEELKNKLLSLRG